jgi:hypothetical protein
VSVHFGFTRYRTYPVTSPSRSASTHCNGDAPPRSLSGSSTPSRSHPGRRASIPARSGTVRAYTASHTSRTAPVSAYRSRTSSVPAGTDSRTRLVSISACSPKVAAP